MVHSFMGSKIDRGDETPVHEVKISSPFFIGRYEVTQAEWLKMMEANPSEFRDCLRCPVDSVSWDLAMEFVSKLNKLDDKFRYSLPTEAEWEYAARAGTTGPYAGDIKDMGWYDENSDSRTHPVGQKLPNAFGLFDMHGNVLEWCEDWYGSYEASSQTDPRGPSAGTRRVMRGGSWKFPADVSRSAVRNQCKPSDCDYQVGLRVVARLK